MDWHMSRHERRQDITQRAVCIANIVKSKENDFRSFQLTALYSNNLRLTDYVCQQILFGQV